jgi:ligand-binding sensor domain-containing protein
LILTACVNNVASTEAPNDTIPISTPETLSQVSAHTSTPEADEFEPSTTAGITDIPDKSLIPGYKPSAWKVYSIENMELSPPNPSIGTFLIYDIAEDNNDSMVFGTTYGLVAFNGQDWTILKGDPGVTSNAHVEISPTGDIWFSLSDGIYKITNNVATRMLKFEDFNANIFDLGGMKIDIEGSVWLILKNELLVFRKSNWVAQKAMNVMPFGKLDGLTINSDGAKCSWGHTAKDETSEDYIKGFAYGGLACYVGDTWVIFDQRTQYGIQELDDSNFFATPITVDENNQVWFYLWKKGLYEFSHGEFFLHVPHNIDRYHPISMIFDQNNTLWLGAWGNGFQLFKYQPGDEGLQTVDNSYEIYEENDTGKTTFHYEGVQILPFTEVNVLHVDSKNNLWIGTELGVYVYDIDW